MTRNVFSGPSRWFEERCPNGRILRLHSIFLIRKRTFGESAANDRFWPKVALRRHRKSVRLCDSHEGLESTTQIGHSGSLMRTSAIGSQS